MPTSSRGSSAGVLMSTTSPTVPGLDAEYAIVIASGEKSVPGMVTEAETGSLA